MKRKKYIAGIVLVPPTKSRMKYNTKEDEHLDVKAKIKFVAYRDVKTKSS